MCLVVFLGGGIEFVYFLMFFWVFFIVWLFEFLFKMKKLCVLFGVCMCMEGGRR